MPLALMTCKTMIQNLKICFGNISISLYVNYECFSRVGGVREALTSQTLTDDGYWNKLKRGLTVKYAEPGGN